MKSEVYYFTGTGNSLVVARDIAKEIEGELISIPFSMNQEHLMINSKKAVVVFPVYIWGIPLIVERFLKKIENIQDRDIYAVATYGGMPGATINIFEKVLKSCGGQLAGGFTVQMPGNYTPMYGAIAEEKQKKMFTKWSEKIKTVAGYINSGSRGKKENNNFLVNGIFSGFIYNRYVRHIPEMDKKYIADEKCNKCGICQKVCPVSNIESRDGKPMWMGKCEQCMACLQWCPQEAIQYGEKTTGRKRYHHPDVNLADILDQAKK